MVRRLTLGFKKSACQYCKNSDKRAMRQGRDFCSESYEPRNGHCVNLAPVKQKKVAV